MKGDDNGVAQRRREYINGRDFLVGDRYDVEAFGKQLVFRPEPGAGDLCGKLWSVALVLVGYLEQELGKDGLRGKRVLEVGAGLGAVGMALACAGAEVVCTDITENIEFNRATIEAAGGSVKSAELWWGEEGFKTSPFAQENGQPFDILVGSDLIYDHDVHEFLLWSMDKFLTAHNCMYMSFIARPYDLIFCAKMHDARDRVTGEALFRVVQLNQDAMDDLGVDDMHILKIVSARQHT